MTYRLLPRGVRRIPDSLHITRDMPEWAEYRAWLKAGNVPGPADPVIVPPLSLPDIKRQKIHELTAEAVRRVGLVMPELADLSSLIVMRELWLSIAPAARQPTAKLTAVINIYQAWNTAVDAVKACASENCVAAVSASWP
jgi:hypothetical protein